MSHNEIVQRIASSISAIENDVLSVISNNMDLMQTVNNKMKTLLGGEYIDYVESFSAMDTYEREAFDSKDYWQYTEKEQRLANLEKAEAYLLLSQLAITLKQMTRGDVISSREQFGVGALSPSSIDQIIQLQGNYYEQAVNIIYDKPEQSGHQGDVFVI